MSRITSIRYAQSRRYLRFQYRQMSMVLTNISKRNSKQLTLQIQSTIFLKIPTEIKDYVSLRFFVLKWYLRFKIKYIKVLMPLLVCRRAHVVFMLFVFLAYSGVQHVLTLYMSNMAGFSSVAGSAYPSRAPKFKSWFFGGVHVAHIFSFLWCPIVCLYVLSSVLSCPL